MRLNVARLCLDCEEVHDAGHCPTCGSETFAFLTRWVTPAARPPRAIRPPGPDVPPAERVEQLDAYERLLKPERSRNGRLMARGAIGLAVLGAARLAWRVGHTIRDGVSRRDARPAEHVVREGSVDPD